MNSFNVHQFPIALSSFNDQFQAHFSLERDENANSKQIYVNEQLMIDTVLNTAGIYLLSKISQRPVHTLPTYSDRFSVDLATFLLTQIHLNSKLFPSKLCQHQNATNNTKSCATGVNIEHKESQVSSLCAADSDATNNVWREETGFMTSQ